MAPRQNQLCSGNALARMRPVADGRVRYMIASPSPIASGMPVIDHEALSPLRRKGFVFWFSRCAVGLWRGPFAYKAQALTAFLFTVVLLALATQYRMNVWYRDFFNALERKDGTALVDQVLIFVPLALASIALMILGVWGRMTLQRKWREWLSRHLIEQWLTNGRYRSLALVNDNQNPEYRIAEDVRVSTEAPVDLVFGLATSLLTAIIFIEVLWRVGGRIDTIIAGWHLVLPGYLVIAAIIYAMITSTAMLFIGRRLVHVFEGKNQAESELRGAATRIRENALQDDNLADRVALETSLDMVVRRWTDLCWQFMQTTFISHGNFLLAPVVGLALCAPRYLAGSMSLGEVTQAAAAFVTVQQAFNWLVDNYARLADWASSANRVSSLIVSIEQIDHPAPDGLRPPAVPSQPRRTMLQPDEGYR